MSNLLNDKDVAAILHLSPSWVRVQRWKRRGGKPHSFTIDPIMIGATPRYRASDLSVWIDGLSNGNATSHKNYQLASVQDIEPEMEDHND